MNPLLITLALGTLLKVVLAALWPLRAEEAMAWAHATAGVGSFQGDALTRLLADWADGGPLGRIVLRAPGLVAALLWSLPLAAMGRRAGVSPHRVAGVWITLHALPGMALATVGWSREPILALLFLAALDAALRCSRGTATAARTLGLLGGLGLLAHPLTLLLPFAAFGCSLDRRERPAEDGPEGQQSLTGPALLGLLLGAALAIALEPGGVLPRATAWAVSLQLGFRPEGLLTWVLGVAAVVGPLAPFLAIRGWRECGKLAGGEGFGPRLVSLAPLAVLAYLALQGPSDPRLVLGPAAAAVVPALLAADPPRRLNRRLRVAGWSVAAVLGAVELAAIGSERLARHLELRLPALAEASAAARPLARPLAEALHERFPDPAPFCDRDPVRGALIALHDRARRPLLDPAGHGASPARALTLLDHPQAAREPLRDWSTVEVEPPVRIPTGGGGVWTVWPAWARDPQPGAGAPNR